MKTLYLTLFFVLFLTTAAFSAVNINTATQAELSSLIGIGPVKAEAIIQHRHEKGRFKDINDLKNVNGIGEKILEKNKGEITVGGTSKTSKTTVQKKVEKTTEKKVETKPTANKKTETATSSKK
jgi:competence protein ComEA